MLKAKFNKVKASVAYEDKNKAVAETISAKKELMEEIVKGNQQCNADSAFTE